MLPRQNVIYMLPRQNVISMLPRQMLHVKMYYSKMNLDEMLLYTKMYYTKCYLSFKIKSCRLALFYPKVWNLCKQVLGKKFLKKKPGNKNFGKKSEFSQVLRKNVTGNKVQCFGFLGLFS